MDWIANLLWLIPALPLAAAGVAALLPRRCRRSAATLAIGSLALAFGLSCVALIATLEAEPGAAPAVRRFIWFELGAGQLELGWLLDPLTAVMLVMVTGVGLLIFIYSLGYMAHDANFTRFFGFLALFAGGMLGVVIANHLLLLFACWELVGLASYLLIGFWHHKPSASAAARKAFITTRVGDLGLFLGLIWLYGESGTLMFYDHGAGCLEGANLGRLVTLSTGAGLGVVTGIGLLILCGAVGKSGQVPLHVWLPDAMEGPTPVSALIHAATMVAAGVFLVARVYPLMAAHPAGAPAQTPALEAVAWVGAITAVFAACIAVAQNDIKRILAYSTVSQLGFMMLGLGVGGVAVGMFHLITHAFFKALLFLGAGSVIHGCHEEQDIRRMGGLRSLMPLTFATYAVGMMALAGVPVFFAGFWSKDLILHAAHRWPVTHALFYLGLLGALLTAFYMTRQVCYVFLGRYRGGHAQAAPGTSQGAPGVASTADTPATPHESPAVMTLPLVVLATFAILLGFLGTPAWPWFQAFLAGEPAEVNLRELGRWENLSLMLLSAGVVFAGLGVGWWLYGRRPIGGAAASDALERWFPALYRLLGAKFHVDELYAATVMRWHTAWARLCDRLDTHVWGGLARVVGWLTLAGSWASRFTDEYVVNRGFDATCDRLQRGGRFTSRLQDGQVQNYLRALALGLTVLLLLLTWACRS